MSAEQSELKSTFNNFTETQELLKPLYSLTQLIGNTPVRKDLAFREQQVRERELSLLSRKAG